MSSTNNQVDLGIGDSRDIQPWRSGVTYQDREEVDFDNRLYIALECHVSTDFAIDLAAGKWADIAGGMSGITLTDLSAVNGITYNNVTGQFKLGGSLTENTTITGSGRSFTFSGVSDFIVSAANSGGFSLQNTQTGLGTSQIIMPSFPTAGVIITNNDSAGVGSTSFEQLSFGGNALLGGNGIILTDAANNRGIVNAADYSANFVLESLVTRRWVEAQGYITSASNIYNADDSLTGNRTMTLDSNSLSIVGDVDTLMYFDAVNNRIGINGSTSPGYAFQVETGDFFLKDGVMGINEAPDSTTRLRITSTGVQSVGARVDMSYTTQTGALSGVMIRSTSAKSGASSTLLGVNSLLQGSASAGIHNNQAGSFRAKTTTSGSATVENIGVRVEATGGDTNYGMQFQDGTEGINKVLAMVTADGKINAVDVNTLVTAPDTFYTANDSFTANRTATMDSFNVTYASTGSANHLVMDGGLGYTGVGIAPTSGNGTLQVFQPESATAPAIYVDMAQATNGGLRKAIRIFNSDATYGGGAGAEQFSLEKQNTGGGIEMKMRAIDGTLTMLLGGSNGTTWMDQFITIGQNTGNNQNKLRVVGLTTGTHFRTENSSGDQVLVALDNGAVRMNLGQQISGDLRWSSTSQVNEFFADASTGRIGIGQVSARSKLEVVGDIETIGSSAGVVVEDRIDGNNYRIYTVNGVLNTELVP